MRGAKNRVTVPPKQNPGAALQDHLVKNLGADNALVQEYAVMGKEKPTPLCLRDLNIPHWLLALLISLAILAFTAFAIFASIVTQRKESNGGPCKSSGDCRQDLGLICNNYRCGCAYSHFWSSSYQICERRRMVNRTCVNDSECDALAFLQCFNVTSGSGTALQCQCQTGMTWIIDGCSFQHLYQGSCAVTLDCDTSRYLYCNTATSPGRCLCNASMFWNSVNSSYGTCEYKRTINQYCLPYDSSWCDNTAPVGQGLICANYSNPYGSEYGLCQCPITQFYNGSAALADGYCVDQHQYGGSCASIVNCDYRVNLVCVNSICTCASGKNYDNTSIIGGGNGYCVNASGYMQNCTSTLLCSGSQRLYCNYAYYGFASVGVCDCNSSWLFWDGLTCSNKLTIGGQCTSNIQCTSADGLFCSNYTQSVNQCDCDKYNYWNTTCLAKIRYNQSCVYSYQCDDNRGLKCQGDGGSFFMKCDCYNTSYIWDSLYVTRNQTCIPKIGFNTTGCNGALECQDYNYLICANGTCACNYSDYWDGSRCQPKKSYTVSCASTYECQDYTDIYLTCGTKNPPCTGTCCVCQVGAYWETCFLKCLTVKKRQQQCSLPGGNCTSYECDPLANLQCINDSSNNQTGGYGWCNCTTLQWWNGTYCRSKGTPAWGTNTSAACTATFQCADYNLVSCPLGGVAGINATCECATTKYWNGYTCIDRVVSGQACTSWSTSALNTSTCLSAAGAGLICTSSTCSSGVCTGGVCQCPGTSVWNSTFLVCVTPSSG